MILADIRKNWDWIKPCLEKLKGMGNVPWIPEDIYAACILGGSRLYLGSKDKGSFMVARVEDGADGELVLFIWIVWGGADGDMKNFGIIERYLPKLEQLAKDNGCKTMKMQSPRLGFKKLGWTPVMVHYVREVN